MNVKKIVLALVVALMGTIVMNAQPPRHGNMSPEQMVEKRVERLDKQLSLSDKQKAELTRIFTEEMNVMQREHAARVEKGDQSDESLIKARREQMKARHEATDAKVEALLTPEQAAKYAQFKREQGKRWHEKGRKGPRHDGKKERRHGDAAKPHRQDGGCNNCTCKDK